MLPALGARGTRMRQRGKWKTPNCEFCGIDGWSLLRDFVLNFSIRYWGIGTSGASLHAGCGTVDAISIRVAVGMLSASARAIAAPMLPQ
jgi:hypothetical protein